MSSFLHVYWVHIPPLDGVKQALGSCAELDFDLPGGAVPTSQLMQSPGSTSRSSQARYSDEEHCCCA